MPKSTVLIVDDNPDILGKRQDLLETHLPECRVLPCTSGPYAMKQATLTPVDGALVSVHMQEQDGIEMCAALRSNILTRHIPVMLISEHPSSTDLRIRGLEAGADDVVAGTIDEMELLARVRVMLRMKRAEDEQRAATERLEEVVAEHTAALNSSEERYRRLVEISPDMIVVCTDGLTTFVNEAGKKVLRTATADELENRPITKLVHPSSVERMEKVLEECAVNGKPVPFVEMQLRAADGETIDVETAAVPFDDRGTQHIQLVIRDVTERKQVNERAKQSQRMEAVGQLAGGVAHDFNNVLTTIRGYSELILESVSPGDPMRDDLKEISFATARAASLTRQLLAFSRRQVLEPRPLALNKVVTEMERMLNRIIGEDIALVTALDDNLSTVKVDLSQIEQVIMNLAVNARDAMENGGKLTVRTMNITLTENDVVRKQLDLGGGDYVVMEVSDTGMGMSPKTMFRIFEPFYTTKPKDKGTGLGLSTVYGIVKQSGGDISVTSKEGMGTCFRVFLPTAENEMPSIPAPVKTGRDEIVGFETVLLVEDEAPVRMLTKRMLERTGYTVLEARHGAEALMICQNCEDPIHLILTDVVMPKMGGPELVERLLKTHPEMRVLLMSGYSDEAGLELGETLENISFLSKPFSYSELTRKVRRILDDDFSTTDPGG